MATSRMQDLIQSTQAHIQHILREANQLVDKLTNEACDQIRRIQVLSFQKLSYECN